MQIHVYDDRQSPLPKHHYYVTQSGETWPHFDAHRHVDDIVLLLETGIITPSIQQRDRITEMEAATLPEPEYHFTPDE